ncbi:MAG: nuclear transport factor 2 family protein [Rhizobiaceae bacterium]
MSEIGFPPTPARLELCMSYTEQALDIQAIKSLIEKQFASASWNAYKQADWHAFKSVFHPDASLFSADQLNAAQTAQDFAGRLESQSKTTRRTFQETAVKTDVFVSGNIASAIVDCENIANGHEIHRTIEMLLLVKDADGWKIVSQAWDKARPVEPVQDAWSI